MIKHISNRICVISPVDQLARVRTIPFVHIDGVVMNYSGKTLLARTLAKVLDVPFSVSDATSFTQVHIFHS